MQLKFNNFISENNLFNKEDKLLVAVSGGVDSMALLCLLWEHNYDFAVAHCNFQLRGEESNDDEKFVERFASFMTKNFHKKRFDTEGSASSRKISIQEAARDLRYEWFEELRQKYDYQYIVTAHHGSDSVETLLFNLSRGTGLKGLTGIKPKNGLVVRPLLFAEKKEIWAYMEENNIVYREDSSNKSDKYARNFIRNTVVPELKKLNPEFEQNILNTIERLNQAQELIDFSIKNIISDIVTIKENKILIDAIKLKNFPANKTILFTFLKDFGFNGQQVETILMDNKTGAKFYSATHELLINRNNFIVQTIENEQNNSKKDVYTEGSYFLEISKKTKSINVKNCSLILNKSIELNPEIIKDTHVAQLNYSQLIFPLKLRHYKTGDRFQPLGMNGNSQLISDYFQQQKLSEFDKKTVWILENGDGQICWIVGFRIAEPFKLLEQTKEILTIKLG
jgi:tRNA(Ile)-lysidine synthase